jgi:hypothetical protein
VIPTVKITTTGIPNEAGPEAAKFTIDRGAETTEDITVFFTISGNAQQNIDYDIADVDDDGDVDVLSASVKDDKIALYETVTNSPPTDLQFEKPR